MKLNEKQLAAARAILTERLPNAEEMRADAVNTIGDTNPDWIGYHAELSATAPQVLNCVTRLRLPTLAEINARVMRDSVAWETDVSRVGRCFDDLFQRATLGAWTLRVWKFGTGSLWYWALRIAESAETMTTTAEYAVRGQAPTCDEAKAKCIAMLQDLGVTL